MQRAVHGVVTAAAAVVAAQAAKELLQDVVGALRINGCRPRRDLNLDRIGEQLVGVPVDFLRHFATQQIACQPRIVFEPASEPENAFKLLLERMRSLLSGALGRQIRRTPDGGIRSIRMTHALA